MKRAIIVSPYFPPSTLAGVHRARILAKYLPACGWEAVIFCVDHRHHEQRLDPDLATLLSSETRVVKVQAWPKTICRALGIGDLGIRGYSGLRSAIRAFLEREGADLLFITALPGFPLVMGPGIKRRYGIPFIADYQDPWLPADYRSARPFTRAWLLYRMAALAEPYALRSADHVTAVSELTNTLVRSRYPWLPCHRFSAVPIGGDAADFDSLRSGERSCSWIVRAPGDIVISYVGNVWTRAHRTLETVFAAIATLKRGKPQLYSRLRLIFVGSSNQPVDSASEVVMPLARGAGIAEIVQEEPRRVPYLDALNIMLRSDILLMLGSDEPHYTASKLFPALLAQRPLLGIFHEESSVCPIAEDVGGVCLVKFGGERPVAACMSEIAKAIETLVETPGVAGRADLNKLEPFLGPAIAQRFATLFELALDQKQH